MGRIRPTAIAVISRPDDGALLVFDGYDSLTRERFHRPLGGGIEFGETAQQAVRRELREEIAAELEDVELIGFLENLFTYKGEPGHELVAVFSARLADASLYARAEIAMVENGDPTKARWVARDAFRSKERPDGPPLYPDGLTSLLAADKR